MGKYLDLHKRLLKKGLKNGLCYEIKSLDNYELIEPDYYRERCAFWAYNEKCTEGITWHSDWEKDSNPFSTQYTPLRQNLVLLLAAINDEDLGSFDEN